jgi:hypothetical protein
MLMLDMCTAATPASKRQDPYTLLAKACLDSYRGVNMPLCVSKCTGTFIFFQHKTRCSFLLTVKKPPVKKVKVQFQHSIAAFELDGEHTTLTSNVQMHRFHESVESVGEVYVRTIPIYASELGSSEVDLEHVDDTWHTVREIDHSNRGMMIHTITLPEQTFPLLKHIRYDIYWLHDPRIV